MRIAELIKLSPDKIRKAAHSAHRFAHRGAHKIVARQDQESVGSAHIFAQTWVWELMKSYPGKIRKGKARSAHRGAHRRTHKIVFRQDEKSVGSAHIFAHDGLGSS